MNRIVTTAFPVSRPLVLEISPLAGALKCNKEDDFHNKLLSSLLQLKLFTFAKGTMQVHAVKSSHTFAHAENVSISKDHKSLNT